MRCSHDPLHIPTRDLRRVVPICALSSEKEVHVNIFQLLRALYNRTLNRRQWQIEFSKINYSQEGDSSTLELFAKYPGMRIISERVGQFFSASGGPNYVEWTMFDHVTMKAYVLTVRPHSRPTPQEINAEMRTALQSIAADPTAADTLAKTDCVFPARMKQLAQRFC